MNKELQNLLCSCSSSNIDGTSNNYVQPKDDYNDHDINCPRYEPDRDEKLLHDWKVLDDDSWDVISALRQKFCQLSESEAEAARLKESPHSSYTYTDRQPYECHSVIERASNLIDYTPESEFLRKIKQQCQYLHDHLPNIFSALNDCFPEGEINECQKCLLLRPRVQLNNSRLWKCCSQQSNFSDEIWCKNKKMRMKHSSIFQRPCSEREKSYPLEPLNFGKKKSEHISRSKKPVRHRKIRKRKSSDSGKCMSENDFEPNLKKPNENSCERCWRFASPARSPVNKPDQRYDPNFRKAHSTTNFEKGDGDLEICGEAESPAAYEQRNASFNIGQEHPCMRHTCDTSKNSPQTGSPPFTAPHICIKQKMEAARQMEQIVYPKQRYPSEPSEPPYSNEYVCLPSSTQHACSKHRASKQQPTSSPQHVCSKRMGSLQQSEPSNLRPKPKCPIHEPESPQQRSPGQRSHQQNCPQQRSKPKSPEQRSQQKCSQQRSEQKSPEQRSQQKCSQQRSEQKSPEQRSHQQKCPQQRPEQKSPERRCSQQRSPQQGCPQQRYEPKFSEQRSPQQRCSQQRYEQKFPEQRSPQQVCPQERSPQQGYYPQGTLEFGASYNIKHTCKQPEEPPCPILCSSPGKKSRPQSCVAGSRDMPKSPFVVEDLDVTEYKDICLKSRKQNFSPSPEPCNRVENVKRTSLLCGGCPPKPPRTCDNSKMESIPEGGPSTQRKSKQEGDVNESVKDKSGSVGSKGGGLDSSRHSKVSKSDKSPSAGNSKRSSKKGKLDSSSKPKQRNAKSSKKSPERKAGKLTGKGRGDDKKVTIAAGSCGKKPNQFDKAHPIRSCKCPPRIPETEGSFGPRGCGGHILCCHCNWEEEKDYQANTPPLKGRPENGKRTCDCNLSPKKPVPEPISPVPKVTTMECPYRAFLNKFGPGRGQGSCGSQQEENRRCSRENHSEISTQELLQCSPRKYFMFYMTKDNKKKSENDVEVLVEELAQGCPKNDTDLRTKDITEKMKKISEPPPDSMALRFQKGVSEACNFPQSSRILYF